MECICNAHNIYEVCSNVSIIVYKLTIWRKMRKEGFAASVCFQICLKFSSKYHRGVISRAVWIPDKGKALEMAPTGLHNFDGSCKLLLELVFEPDRSGKRPNETMVPGLHNIGGPCRLLPEVVDRIVRTRFVI